MVVTYAMDGGPNASAALAGSLEHVGLRVVPTRPQLAFKDGSIGDGRLATLRGELGERSVREWEENGGKEKVLRAWGELKMLLVERGGEHDN